jgi:chromosome segregation ATPase
LRFEGLESIHRLERWIAEGVQALSDYLDEVYGPDEPAFRWLRELARHLYQRVETTERDSEGLRLDLASFKRAIQEAEIETPERDPVGLCLDLAAFKQAIQEAEAAAVRKAQTKLDELTQEHRDYTKAWARANDLQQGVLKEEMERLEKEMAEWRERAIPLAERLEALHNRLEERAAERKKLLAEWPTLEGREKGEALRRLFKTVTLFWERTYHPTSARRPHTTDRQGRYSYTLQRDRIQWAFAEFNSVGRS